MEHLNSSVLSEMETDDYKSLQEPPPKRRRRPHVPPNERKRTWRASVILYIRLIATSSDLLCYTNSYETCRRNKLKCDGLTPCKRCGNTKKTCTYSTLQPSQSMASPLSNDNAAKLSLHNTSRERSENNISSDPTSTSS